MTVAGHVYITYQQILDETQTFEMPVLMYNGDGTNPYSASDPGTIPLQNSQAILTYY